MLTVTEVWEEIAEMAGPLDTERVPLASAVRRVLRETVRAPVDQPAFDRSAIDGYVVPITATSGTTLRIAGEIPMGRLAPGAPSPGECLRVFTGSAVPEGDVGLVMWEDAALVRDKLTLKGAPSADFIRRRGSQAIAGTELLPAGLVLNEGALALLASVGNVTPLVARRARVAHLVTGGELVPPELEPAPGQIRDSNSTLIAALLEGEVAELSAHARAGETYADHASAFARLLAGAPDVILVSGGSSGGEHDHAARLFAEHGFTLVVNQVASRPGKPLLLATRGAQVAIGLPGNPLSHFVCYHLFVTRVLARLSGAAPASILQLPLAPGAKLRAHPRETWWPATLTASGYAPLPWADSSDLTVLTRTHALLRVPSAAAPDTTADGLLV